MQQPLYEERLKSLRSSGKKRAGRVDKMEAWKTVKALPEVNAGQLLNQHAALGVTLFSILVRNISSVSAVSATIVAVFSYLYVPARTWSQSTRTNFSRTWPANFLPALL